MGTVCTGFSQRTNQPFDSNLQRPIQRKIDLRDFKENYQYFYQREKHDYHHINTIEKQDNVGSQQFGCDTASTSQGESPFKICSPQLTPTQRQKSQIVDFEKSRRITRENIHDIYELGDVIGTGRYGQVISAFRKVFPEKKFAVKQISKKRIQHEIESLEKELEILLRLDHPNIIRFYEIFQDEKYFHIVTELCQGGDLFSLLEQYNHLDEAKVVQIVSQILEAVEYMHESGICHRDLKPENIMFAHVLNEKNQVQVKLIDFGLSKIYDNIEYMQSKIGTPYYVAPDIFTNKYDNQCDLWSIGVITYIMLCGYPPFNAQTESQLYMKIKFCDYEFVEEDWHSISKDARNFIQKLLIVDSKQRMTASQALNNQWIKINQKQSTSFYDEVIMRINAFEQKSTIQCEILKTITSFIDNQTLTCDAYYWLQQYKEQLIQQDSREKLKFSEFEYRALDKNKYLTHTNIQIAYQYMNTLQEEGGISIKGMQSGSHDQENTQLVLKKPAFDCMTNTCFSHKQSHELLINESYCGHDSQHQYTQMKNNCDQQQFETNQKQNDKVYHSKRGKHRVSEKQAGLINEFITKHGKAYLEDIGKKSDIQKSTYLNYQKKILPKHSSMQMKITKNFESSPDMKSETFRSQARTSLGMTITKAGLEGTQIDEEVEFIEEDGKPNFMVLEDVFSTPKMTSFKNSISSNVKSESFSRNLQKSYITQSKILTQRDLGTVQIQTRDTNPNRGSSALSTQRRFIQKTTIIDVQNMTEAQLKNLLFT